MKKKYFLIFCLSFIAIPAHSDFMEDRKYEKTIHNIYLKHYKEPVSNSDWNKTIQSLPKNYKLKFKDNMWDLSGSFFKNSLYWSKLWVANPQVENPHLIYNGDFLKFDPLTLAKLNTSKYSVDIQSQFPGLVIPKQKFSKGALKESEIPSSLPNLLSFRTYDSAIDISQLQHIDIEKQTIIPFYLADEKPPSAGEIISKDGYGEAIGLGSEHIIVRIDSDVSIGSILTVFKNSGRIGNFLQLFTGITEEQIIIKGKIKILSYLQGTDSLYVASVIESLQSIFSGDSLLKGEPQVYNFSQKGTIGTGKGLIIGTPNKDQLLLSINSIVYLDKGLISGIRAGDIFYIRGNADIHAVLKRPYKYDLPVLGKLKVIHSIANRATGIIIESRDQIYVGDIFSGELDRVEDLSGSQDHEEFDAISSEKEEQLLNTEDQIPFGTEEVEEEQNQDVLIDFEGTTGDEGRSLEPDQELYLEGLEEDPEEEDIEEYLDEEEDPEEEELEEDLDEEELEEDLDEEELEEDLDEEELEEDLDEEELEEDLDEEELEEDLDEEELEEDLDEEELEEDLDEEEDLEEDLDEEELEEDLDEEDLEEDLDEEDLEEDLDEEDLEEDLDEEDEEELEEDLDEEDEEELEEDLDEEDEEDEEDLEEEEPKSELDELEAL